MKVISVALAVFVFFGTIPIRAEVETAPPRTVLERGLLAAEAGNWPEALERFEEVQLAEPSRPQTYFNMGLAYRHAGSPILAAIWFRAFLEAYPDAPQAGTVGDEINQLDQLIDNKIKELLRLALESAKNYPVEYEQAKLQAFGDIAFTYNATGKVDNAFAIGQLSIYSETP